MSRSRPASLAKTDKSEKWTLKQVQGDGNSVTLVDVTELPNYADRAYIGQWFDENASRTPTTFDADSIIGQAFAKAC